MQKGLLNEAKTEFEKALRIDAANERTLSYLVTLDDGGRDWRFTVTLSDDYHQRLTGGAETKESLIKRSFEFLLERESAGSILSSFDLTVIRTYFPEYEKTINK